MIRIDKRPRITRKMSTAGRPLRIVAPVVALLAAATLGGPATLADMVVVQQDDTPIASAPGVGGRILTRVDAGVTLTVLGREGEWLQVEGAHLPATGTLWIPAGRVGDIVAAPIAMAPVQPVAAGETPQFQMMTGSTGRAALGTEAAAGARNSDGVSTSATRSTGTNAARTSTAVQSSGTATPATGSSTPAAGSAVSAASNGGTAVDSNSTPAQGNPTAAVNGNPTPALGNPTPAATGNATPALGNPTPAMGNSVSGFGRTTARTP